MPKSYDFNSQYKFKNQYYIIAFKLIKIFDEFDIRKKKKFAVDC